MPLGHENSTRQSTPVITYLLIAINLVVFFLEMTMGEFFIVKWSFIPSRFFAKPGPDISTIFTAMFMHGGTAHLGGNMLYLWIFGDNVEDRLGKIPYLIFYLACGIAATFSQAFFDATSNIPNLGASGAIAGVLGAYMRLFPGQKVSVLLGRHVTEVSALIVIGVWFALQFYSSVGALFSSQPGQGGVAYMAHVGGFIAGLAIAFFITKNKVSKTTG